MTKTCFINFQFCCQLYRCGKWNIVFERCQDALDAKNKCKNDCAVSWVTAHWPLVKITGQGQMSKNWPKSTKWAISLFHLQTSYLVPRYNPIRHIQWSMCRWSWPRSRSKVKVKFFPKMGKKTKNWSYLGGYFTYRLHTWYQGTTQ